MGKRTAAAVESPKAIQAQLEPKSGSGVDASVCYFLVERDFHTGQALRRWRHGGRSRKVGAESPALAAAPAAWHGRCTLTLHSE